MVAIAMVIVAMGYPFSTSRLDCHFFYVLYSTFLIREAMLKTFHTLDPSSVHAFKKNHQEYTKKKTSYLYQPKIGVNGE